MAIFALESTVGWHTHLLPFLHSVVVMWTCTHTHTKPSRILATRSTTSVGTWTTLSVPCIANHSTWLCVVRNREGPFAVHIETKFPTPPSTAHIDQLYNSPFTHAHTHTRAVPCRAVPCCHQTTVFWSGLSGVILQIMLSSFSLRRRHARIKLFPAVQQTQKSVPCNTVCRVHLFYPTALASL